MILLDQFIDMRINVAEALRKIFAFYFEKTDDLVDNIAATSKRGDVLLIMSNGGFDNIHERLLETL